jgi:hypothetical protein
MKQWVFHPSQHIPHRHPPSPSPAPPSLPHYPYRHPHRAPRRWGSTKRRLYLSYMDCPCALDITDSPSVIVFTYADITDMPFASGEPEEIYITIG